MPTVLGLDPGTAGAFAILNEAGAVLVDDLPAHQTQHGRGAKIRAELDLHAFRFILADHRVDHVFLERVAARPGQGVSSMFRSGYASGALYGLLVGLNLPVTFVLPQIWQKHFGIGPSPDAARQRAVQLYPQVADRLTKQRDAHRADALLIADYGLHRPHGAAAPS
jgi:crossover junction endodeoxyribonuclease RuvC